MKSNLSEHRLDHLRIGDTSAFDERRLDSNKLLLYTAKTGAPVYVRGM
jgi:hypothetical protein